MKKNILFLMALVLGLNCFTKAQMMEDLGAGISSETQEDQLFLPNTPGDFFFKQENIGPDVVKKIVLRDQSTDTSGLSDHTISLDDYINNQYIDIKHKIIREKTSTDGKMYIYSENPRLDTIMPYLKYKKTKKYPTHFGEISKFECLKPSKFKRFIKLVTIGVPLVVAAACGTDAIIKNGYLPAVSEFVKKYYTPGQICTATGNFLKPGMDLAKEYGYIAITAARTKMSKFFEYLAKTTKPKTGWFPFN